MPKNNKQTVDELKNQIRGLKIKCLFFEGANKGSKRTRKLMLEYEKEGFRGSDLFLDLTEDIKRYKIKYEAAQNENKTLEEELRSLKGIMDDMLYDKQNLVKENHVLYNSENTKEHKYIDQLRKRNADLIDDLKNIDYEMTQLKKDLKLYELIASNPLAKNKDYMFESILQDETSDDGNMPTVIELQQELNDWEMKLKYLKQVHEEDERFIRTKSKQAETAFKASPLYGEMRSDLVKYKTGYETMESENHVLKDEIKRVQSRMENIYWDNQDLAEKYQIQYFIGITNIDQCIEQLQKENQRLSDILKEKKDIIVSLEAETDKYKDIKDSIN